MMWAFSNIGIDQSLICSSKTNIVLYIDYCSIKKLNKTNFIISIKLQKGKMWGKILTNLSLPSRRIIFVSNLNESVVALLEKKRLVCQDSFQKILTALHTISIKTLSHFVAYITLNSRDSQKFQGDWKRKTREKNWKDLQLVSFDIKRLRRNLMTFYRYVKNDKNFTDIFSLLFIEEGTKENKTEATNFLVRP